MCAQRALTYVHMYGHCAVECEFVYLHTCMYVRMYVCTFTHSSSQPDVRTTLKERRCVCARVCVRVCMRESVCVTKCGKVRLILIVRTYKHIRMHEIYVCIRIRTYVRKYVHKHVCMHEMRTLTLVHCANIPWSTICTCNTPPIIIHSAANHL